MWCCSSPCLSRCNHYDAVQMCTVVFLYLQVACALVGSLGAIYTGIVLANLVLALFALVAIESGSQCLGRAYAGLLALSLLLDIVWFSLFTNEIRYFWNETHLGKFGALSMKIMFLMQATGSALRFFSSCLWCQMYRLGAMSNTSVPLQFEGLHRGIASLEDAEGETVLGGSIYDQAVLSSLRSFSRKDGSDVESSGQGSGDESQLQSPLLHEEST